MGGGRDPAWRRREGGDELTGGRETSLRAQQRRGSRAEDGVEEGRGSQEEGLGADSHCQGESGRGKEREGEGRARRVVVRRRRRERERVAPQTQVRPRYIGRNLPPPLGMEICRRRYTRCAQVSNARRGTELFRASSDGLDACPSVLRDRLPQPRR